MKKKLLLILMLIAAVVVMPRVYADEGITLKQVTDITNEDTLQSQDKGTMSQSNDYSTTTITYNVSTFKLLGTDDDADRDYDGYAWIGISVQKPDNAQKYVITYNGVTEEEASAADITEFFGFNAATLKKAVDEARNVVFTYEILWKGSNNETAKQTITIIVVPSGITLNAKDDDGGAEVWNEDTYEDEVKEVMTEIYSDLEGAISVAKGIDTSKYTATSVKALLQAIEDAEAFGKDLTKNNQGDVRALTKAITTAIANLVVKGDEPVTPGSTATDTNKTGEQAPDTFDAGLTYVGLALSAVGASVVSIKKLRNN